MHHKFNIPEKSRSDKAKGWEKMRNELNVEKAKIFLVKDFADEPRHGGLTSISDSERAEVFTATWEIIGRVSKLSRIMILEWDVSGKSQGDIPCTPELTCG